MAKKKYSDAEGLATPAKARVLTSCEFGEPNDVVTLEADVAALAQADGLVDTTAESVAYAESLAAGG